MTSKDNTMKNDLLKLAAQATTHAHDPKLHEKLKQVAPHWFPTPTNDNTKKPEVK